jgi:hypothetical protein
MFVSNEVVIEIIFTVILPILGEIMLLGMVLRNQNNQEGL